MEKAYDIIISGASLGGVAAAARIAQHGYSVLLLEKRSEPQSKACGEGLSSTGIRTLYQLGFTSLLETVNHRPFVGFAIRRAGKSRRSVIGAGDNPLGVGIARGALDRFLLQSISKRPEIDLQLSSRAVVNSIDSDGVIVSVNGQRVRGRSLIIAEGLHSRTASLLGFKRTAPKDRYGISLKVRGDFEESRVSILPHPMLEAYITPIAKDLVNISFVGTKSSIKELLVKKERHDIWGAIRDEFSSPLTLLSEPIGSGPFGSHSYQTSCGSAFLVGDALASFDPIGGMGMTHALMTGELAGRLMVEVLSNLRTLQSAQSEFDREARSLRHKVDGFSNISTFAIRYMPSKISPVANLFRLSEKLHSGLTRGNLFSALLVACGNW